MPKLEKSREWHMKLAEIYIIFCMVVILAHPILKDKSHKSDYLEKVSHQKIYLDSRKIVFV